MKIKIGMYDSGVGGLSVANAVSQKINMAHIIYLADNAHVPYGERNFDEIRNFSIGITDFLIKEGAGLIVVACNMSSAVSLDLLKEKFPHIPIYGMIEFGAKSALEGNDSSAIGILATSGTVKSRAYTNFIHNLNPNISVIEEACPEFVPLVEGQKTHSKEAKQAVETHISPLLAAGCKSIILGCTHYPFLIDLIKEAAGEDIRIIDPAELLARHITDNFSDRIETGTSGIYYATGGTEDFKAASRPLVNKDISSVSHVNWTNLILKKE